MIFSVINVLSGVSIFSSKCVTTFSFANPLSKNISHIHWRFSTNKPNLTSIDLTVSKAFNHWQNVFESNKIPEPKLSIQNILAHILGHHQANEVNLDLEKNLTPDQQETLNSLCECRLARMPVQYIIKEWDFRDLRLSMCPPVFIPRPETEELIDLVVKEASDCKNFLEVGCGTGAISLSLLQALPEAMSVAIDQSIAACQLTLKNARSHNLQDRINILHCKLNDNGSLNKSLPINQFDVLVSNPPYVPSRQILDLEPEIKLYEDLRALEAGKDGLRVIKALFTLAKNILKENGDIFLEVDSSHPNLIKTLLEQNADYGLAFIKHYKDLYDRDRFVHLKKK